VACFKVPVDLDTVRSNLVWRFRIITLHSRSFPRYLGQERKTNGFLGPTSIIDPGTATLPGTNIYIGARHNARPTNNSQATYFFEGRIDEVAFWDSALTQENINWLQTNSLSSLPANLEGDFDGNLDVDGADFLSWQRDLGDATNLGLWEDNFGFTGAVPAVSTVPEPSTFLLTGFGVLAMTLRSVRRRR